VKRYARSNLIANDAAEPCPLSRPQLSDPDKRFACNAELANNVLVRP